MDVVLLGVVVPGVENPALATLGAALDRAGLAYDVVPFGGAGELERMLAAVARAQPRVCALSLQTAAATPAVLAFTRALRACGYTGQIVAGGHAATLGADDLLAADTGIDVVIELAGEDALIGLARGEPVLELPGTRTRTGRGKRALPIAPRAFPHPQLGEHLGFATADLVLSRGCEAQCEYCTVAAISALAQQAGAPRHERRATGAIADEIAELAERGARAFHILDDNLLPLEPDAGVAWARALQAALRTRKVPVIALALDLRADAVTPALADALADLGLVRARVGIDGYTPPQLRALGRTAAANAGPNALALLAERGVLCVATTLLVGPTIRFAALLDEVDALAAARFAPVELLAVEPRPGTPYHDRVRAHGLIGRFADPRTALVAELLAGLPTRTGGRTVAIALDDLAWSLGVAQRLAPSVNVDGPRATFSNVGAAWNADLVRVLRLAIAAADAGDVTELLARERPVVTAHDEGMLALCDTALAEVALGVSKLHGRPVRAHQRAALLAQSAAGTQ